MRTDIGASISLIVSALIVSGVLCPPGFGSPFWRPNSRLKKKSNEHFVRTAIPAIPFSLRGIRLGGSSFTPTEQLFHFLLTKNTSILWKNMERTVACLIRGLWNRSINMIYNWINAEIIFIDRFHKPDLQLNSFENIGLGNLLYTYYFVWFLVLVAIGGGVHRSTSPAPGWRLVEDDVTRRSEPALKWKN